MCDLGVFWSHKLKEVVSDPNNSIDNRIDSHKFFQWVEILKKRKYIEDFELYNDFGYRIIDNGKDEVMNISEKQRLFSALKDYLKQALTQLN